MSQNTLEPLDEPPYRDASKDPLREPLIKASPSTPRMALEELEALASELQALRKQHLGFGGSRERDRRLGC